MTIRVPDDDRIFINVHPPEFIIVMFLDKKLSYRVFQGHIGGLQGRDSVAALDDRR